MSEFNCLKATLSIYIFLCLHESQRKKFCKSLEEQKQSFADVLQSRFPLKTQQILQESICVGVTI